MVSKLWSQFILGKCVKNTHKVYVTWSEWSRQVIRWNRVCVWRGVIQVWWVSYPLCLSNRRSTHFHYDHFYSVHTVQTHAPQSYLSSIFTHYHESWTRFSAVQCLNALWRLYGDLLSSHRELMSVSKVSPVESRASRQPAAWLLWRFQQASVYPRSPSQDTVLKHNITMISRPKTRK